MRFFSFLLFSTLTIGLFGLAPFSEIRAANVGDLVTCPDFSAVYYLAEDGSRWFFANDKTYFTWFSDFDQVIEISCNELSGYPLGRMITNQPGTRMVKIQTVPNVYAVESGGLLRAIQNEEQAIDLFGLNWNQRIDDVPDGFWSKYTEGTSLPEGAYPNGTIIQSESTGQYYHVEDNVFRPVSADLIDSVLKNQALAKPDSEIQASLGSKIDEDAWAQIRRIDLQAETGALTELIDWDKESGVRIASGVSTSTIVSDDGSYLMYYTSIGGIYLAMSDDGINFNEVGLVLNPGAAGSEQESVTNPAIMELATGDYRMIYEGGQGAGEDRDRRLFSAISSDGLAWQKEDGVRFEDYGDENPYVLFTSVPDIIQLDNGDWRMYYTRDISSATAISEDNGLTWVKEGNLDFGSRIVIDPDIVRFDDGDYKLFFTTFDSVFGEGEQYVMSATSSDGFSFTLDQGKRLEPSVNNGLLVDPDIVELLDGAYRMYYAQAVGNDFQILSAVSE